jgi:hypothetical protein
MDPTQITRWLVYPHMRKDFRNFWAQTQTAVREGRIADAIAAARMFSSHPDAPNIVKYGYGCLLMMAGEFDLGRRVVASVGSFRQGADTYGTSFFGYDDQRTFPASLVKPYQVLRSQLDQWRQAKYLIVSACDLRYFRAFYRQLIQSVKRYHHQAHGLVFLIANTDDEFKEASKLVSTQGLDSIVPIRFSYTLHEDKPLRVGFACARWSALAMLIDHLRHDQQLIIVDVDMEQVKEMDEVVAGDESEVQLLLYPSEFMNLVAFVSGSLVPVKASPAGSRFVKSVATTVDQCFDENLVDWHLDQFALLVAYLKCSDINFKILSQDLVLSQPFAAKLDKTRRSNAVFVSRTASITGVSSLRK